MRSIEIGTFAMPGGLYSAEACGLWLREDGKLFFVRPELAAAGDSRPTPDPAVTIQLRGTAWVVHEEHGMGRGGKEDEKEPERNF